MKRILTAIMLLTTISSMAFLALSCSDKDEEGNSDINPNNETPEKSIDVTVEKEGVVMTYCLLNSKGIPSTTFVEGEEIIFDLKIENTTDQPIFIPYYPDLFGYDTFRVFTSDGEDCGVSWIYPSAWLKTMEYFLPSTPRSYQCPWYSDESIKPTYPFIFQPTAKKLTKGSYYTEAHCNFENGAELTELCCKLNFNIQPAKCTAVEINRIEEDIVYATAVNPEDFYHQFYYISFKYDNLNAPSQLQVGDVIDINIIEYEYVNDLYLTYMRPPIFCKQVELCK